MTETYPDMYLTIDDSIYPPIIRLKGRRIGIQHVIMPYWSGQSVAEISHGFAKANPSPIVAEVRRRLGRI